MAAWIPALRLVAEVALPSAALWSAGMLLWAVAAGWRTAGRAVWLLSAWCGVAALRSPDLWDGLGRAATWVGPWWVAAAVAAERGERTAPWILRAATVPLALWWGGAALFGPATVVEHGLTRWIGPYANPHNAAMALVVVAVLGTWEAPRRPWGAAVAALAWPAVALTGVRTAWLAGAVAVGVLLLLRGRRLWAAAGLAVGLLAIGVSRRVDVLALLTATPPVGGWGALGTGRVAIWRDAWAAWMDRGAADWAFGLGMGGHLRLARPFDPHAEWLSLWFQTGAVGLALWMAALGHWVSRARAGSDRHRVDVALALVAAAVVADLVSNGFASRPTAAWLVWGLVGAAAGRHGPVVSTK